MIRTARIASTVLVVVVLAACGGAATPSPASTVASSAAPSSNAASQPPGPSAGASGASGAAACAPAPAGASATVNATIAGFAYSPATIEAKVGDVIAWKNDDSAPHTATLEDGSCTTDTIAAGATGALVFSAAGTYTYKCSIHPAQMKGFKIVVT